MIVGTALAVNFLGFYHLCIVFCCSLLLLKACALKYVLRLYVCALNFVPALKELCKERSPIPPSDKLKRTGK